MKHGGLAEIIATHHAPAGFVRQDSGSLSTTEQIQYKESEELINRKQSQRRGGWNNCFKKIACGTITDDVAFTQSRPDGSTDWVNNKGFLQHLARKGHPLVKHNPALIGEAVGG